MLSLVGRLLTRRFFDRPILVIGTGRSGTSVLVQALGRHPLIADLPGEAPFLTSIGYSAYLFEAHQDRKYYRESLKVTQDYFYDQLRRLGFEVAAGPHYGLKLFIKGLLGRGPSPLGRRFWAAKTFPEDDSAQGWLSLYPGAQFIYIVRNGCDVVHSMTKFGGFSQRDFRQHCLSWAEGVEKYRYLTDSAHAMLVRQEELLNEPEALFTRLFEFLEIPNDSGPADFTRTTVVHPLDKQTQTGINPRTELQHRQPAHEKWTTEQKTIFKNICEPGMLELGYKVPF
jgi:hypothetical protein